MIRSEHIKPEDEARVHERLDEKVRSLDEKASSMLSSLIRDVRTLYALLKDKTFSVDWTDKAKIIAALLYFITPIDLIPDFLVGVGYIDDAVVLALAMKTLRGVIDQYHAHSRRTTEVSSITP